MEQLKAKNNISVQVVPSEIKSEYEENQQISNLPLSETKSRSQEILKKCYHHAKRKYVG